MGKSRILKTGSREYYDLISIFKSDNAFKFDNVRVLKDIRCSKWVSEAGICIEIDDVSSQLIKGNFYYKSLTWNKCSFEGIVQCENNEFTFVSFFKEYIPEYCYECTSILKSKITHKDLSRGTLEIRLSLYDSNGIISEETFILAKTNKPITSLKCQQLKLIKDMVPSRKSLN